MTKSSRNLALILGLFMAWVGLLTLGSYLFVSSEALGGMVLGLTGIIIGIILPYHLWKVNIISFRFIPEKRKIRRVTGLSFLFMAFYLIVYPSGFLGSRATMHFFESPPSFEEGLSTFVFLLISAISYTLIFWGGLLFAITKVGNKLVAVIVTSLLFSVYHVSQFPFIPLTFKFFTEMFVCAVILTSFTLLVDCVLPALIVAQIEQFFFFAARRDNPFSDPAQAVSGVVLVLLLWGVYSWVFRKRGDYNPKNSKS